MTNRNLVLLVCILMMHAPLLFSDTWSALYGAPNNDRALAAIPTRDGGFLIGGRSTDGSVNSLVIKLDAAGAILWQKKFEPGYIHTVQQTRDDGYLLSGRKFIAKINSSGNHEWLKRYGSNLIHAVQQLKDGGYIVVGRSNGVFDSWDFWVAKLAANGSVEWQEKIGGTNSDTARAVFQTSDGGFIVAGETNSFLVSIRPDILVVKISADGKVLWKKLYDLGPFDHFLSMTKTNDGGFVISGRIDAPNFILKLNSNGALQWSKSYEFVGANSLRQIPGGGFVMLYAHNIIKLSSAGDFVARKRFLPVGITRGDISALESIRPIKGGGFIVSGRTTTGSTGSTDFWVLKLNDDLAEPSSCINEQDFALPARPLSVSVHSDLKLRVTTILDPVIDVQPKMIVAPIQGNICP